MPASLNTACRCRIFILILPSVLTPAKSWFCPHTPLDTIHRSWTRL